jgi:hypothetical protein
MANVVPNLGMAPMHRSETPLKSTAGPSSFKIVRKTCHGLGFSPTILVEGSALTKSWSEYDSKMASVELLAKSDGLVWMPFHSYSTVVVAVVNDAIDESRFCRCRDRGS